MLDPIQHFFGEIILVIFVIGLLCRIAEIRSEVVVGGLFDVARALVIGIVKILIGLFSLILNIFGLPWRKSPRR